ncbi:hypothetical protein O181_023421 [Austropuccinia psidii MF-1]|uniref:PH domain-containing protein n=1 Tax=Austropuccinia psidii MF-1 TaxID=1389203 RepID=A0A9Q3CER2_9BASI|nr:hypothetical protein [Austropuccinia psidii MF-1]
MSSINQSSQDNHLQSKSINRLSNDSNINLIQFNHQIKSKSSNPTLTQSINNNNNKSNKISAVDESLKSFQLLQALRSSDTQSILNLLPSFSLSTSPTTPSINSPNSNHQININSNSTSSSSQSIISIIDQTNPNSQHIKRSSSITNDTLNSNQDIIHSNYLKITPLHLAVRCAKYHIVELVLKNLPSNSINLQDLSGQTPLHLACKLGRIDVIKLLLNQSKVDDSIRDQQSKTCYEVCKNSQVLRVLQDYRDQLHSSFLALLSAYIASPQTSTVSQSLINSDYLRLNPNSSAQNHSTTGSNEDDDLVVVEDDKVLNNRESVADKLFKFMTRSGSRSLHLSLKEDQTGSTLLHEAAKRKDVHLIKLAISKGADVLARDRRNRMPIDVTTDEKIKTILRLAASCEGKALQAHSNTKPWNSAEIIQGSTGLLSSTTNPSTPLTTNIIVQPTLKGYLSKWTNMARGYSTRWIVLDKGFLSYYREQKDEGKTLRGSIAMSVAIVAGPEVTKDKLRFEVSSKLSNSYPRFYLKGSHPLEVMRWVEALKQAIDASNQLASLGPEQPIPSKLPSTPISLDKRGLVTRHLKRTTDADSSKTSLFGRTTSDEDDNYGDEMTPAPLEDEMNLLAQSLKAHIEMTKQLVDSLVIPINAPSLLISNVPLGSTQNVSNSASNSTSSSANPVIGSQRQVEVKQALKRSLEDLNGMFDDYLLAASKRERFHIRRYENALLAKKLWEENMQALITSQAAMEQELESVARDSSRRKKQLRNLRAGLSSSNVAINATNLPSNKAQDEPVEGQEDQTMVKSLKEASKDENVPMLSLTAMIPRPENLGGPSSSDSESDSDSDSDEFFEAIETGAIAIEPLMVIKSEEPALESEMEYLKEGYEVKRTTLPIKSDDRPSVSLWGILKNSIGKDLTKISFPVSFNEPISMLQRMSEDLQFSECLDAAAEQSDSLIRIAYVAGFAMSNYSSTVDRLAKPFNPLLGETYEYVDPEKKFRYFSEQISHHPPMSACFAESPRWTYFGETDAKNKFTGKSFEIRPTGIAHAVLKIPKTFVGTEDYPIVKTSPNRVEEHYSWKKVTTVISNFILGSPSIDHYGDMEITNHRRGERCLLTFKPRGWRGKDANEVKGSVYDRNGKLVWELAGKWTTQLIGRRAGSATGELGPDESVGNRGEREYLQLWKTHPRPKNVPFNLTEFAVGLNNINDKLKIWLPPTDCRLRPDQHAFERGSWDKANELKTSLEDYQRMSKRKREIGELPPHQPRWFRQVDDPDSGEHTWDAIRCEEDENRIEYWEERKKVGEQRKKGIDAEWTDVDHIFGGFELIEG